MSAKKSMRQSLVSLLLLATVALSSSNVLPMMSTNLQESETPGINGQEYDNIFSNNRNIKDVINYIFYKVPVGTIEYDALPKKISKYVNTNNNRADESLNGILYKEDNYDDEGFRKEQWHNYPRQLDRLHKHIFDFNTDIKRTPGDPNDSEKYITVPETVDRSIDDIVTNEFLTDDNDGEHNYDAVVAAANPLLILKIHLTCLNNRLKNRESTKYYEDDSIRTNARNDIDDKGEEERIFSNEINPAAKVKREGVSDNTEISSDNSVSTKKSVSKRLFSLWSRLQSLSHKGHELPHRRHLHAFYGLPDADGNGALTAETRATLMRPPGSPLRWG